MKRIIILIIASNICAFFSGVFYEKRQNIYLKANAETFKAAWLNAERRLIQHDITVEK